jgi:hypothetical protein
MSKEETSFCPECGEEILAIATRCKNCAAILSGRWGQKRGQPSARTGIVGITMTVLFLAILVFGIHVSTDQLTKDSEGYQSESPSEGTIGLSVEGKTPEEIAFDAERKEALSGNASSQFRLAEMYQNGRGVEQDREQATFWYRSAATNGHQTAQDVLAARRRVAVEPYRTPSERTDRSYVESKKAERRMRAQANANNRRVKEGRAACAALGMLSDFSAPEERVVCGCVERRMRKYKHENMVAAANKCLGH